MAIPTLERVLDGRAALIAVHTLEDAMALLTRDQRIDLVVAGMHFNESRMFDLLRYVRHAFPLMPFVSCRVLQTRLAPSTIDAVAMSSESLGAAAHFDLPTASLKLGILEAEAAFRRLVLSHLPSAAPGRPLPALQSVAA
jgi:hypothetical protein